MKKTSFVCLRVLEWLEDNKLRGVFLLLFPVINPGQSLLEEAFQGRPLEEAVTFYWAVNSKVNVSGKKGMKHTQPSVEVAFVKVTEGRMQNLCKFRGIHILVRIRTWGNLRHIQIE